MQFASPNANVLYDFGFYFLVYGNWGFYFLVYGVSSYRIRKELF